MLEGVLDLGKETRLVQELRGLKRRQAAPEVGLGQLRDRLEQRQRDVLADHRGGLQQALVPGRQPVDPRRQDGLHGRRDLDRRHRLDQPVRSRVAGQDLGFHQAPHALLQEQGIPLGALDQETPERLELRLGPEEGPEQLLGALGGKRIEPELGVVAPAPPAVAVLRPVIDQEQEPGRRQALDQAVQDGLGLGVYPVQVLEDHQERLHLALAEQEALDAVQDALAALGRVERLPPRVSSRGHVQEHEQGGQGRLQSPVQGEELARHLLADPAPVVAGLDLEVRLQQVAHRQVGRGLAVGDRAGFQDEPAVGPVGMGQLPEEAGLTDAGLADDGHDLALAPRRHLRGPPQTLHLRLPPHEAAEPAAGRGLDPGTGGAGAAQLVDLHRLGQALDRHGAERPHGHIPLGQPQRLRA